MRQTGAFVLVALFAWASGVQAQANCTRTLGDYNDRAYSETSMSYRWSNGSAPRWLADAVKEWNACSGSPDLSVGTTGEKQWTVRQTTAVPNGNCGYSDDQGKYGPAGTIYLSPPRSGCSDPLPNLFLHEMGHSLGLAHDGQGCPITVMTGNPSIPLPSSVSSVNCTAVLNFKKEKINRDKNNRSGGGGSGPGRPGRGTDPISLCTENPHSCVESDQAMTCRTSSESRWDSSTSTLVEVTTVTCSY